MSKDTIVAALKGAFLWQIFCYSGISVIFLSLTDGVIGIRIAEDYRVHGLVTGSVLVVLSIFLAWYRAAQEAKRQP